MADQKVSQMPDGGTIQDTDEVMTARAGASYSVTGANLKASVTTVTGNAGTATKLATARNIDGQAFDGSAAITVVAPGTHAATSKATPVDADELPLVDSAASNVLKKLTWANLKATIKAYTDTLYPSGSGTSTGTNTGDQTSVSGNAGTATKLATARNIDGQSFDGSADITVIAPGTHAATSKTTPVDADEIPIVDSAASNVLKKLTGTNLKAYLKTYFDTLYQASGASAGGDLTGTYPNPTIGAGKVLNAAIGSGAAIAVSKLAAGSAGQVIGGTGPAYAYPPGYEFGYTQRTTNLSVTGTSSGSPTDIAIALPAIAFDGSTAVWLEFACSDAFVAANASGNSVSIGVYESGSLVAIMTTVGTGANANMDFAILARYKLTPSNASHTYSVQAWRTNANCTLSAGAGTSGARTPMYFRCINA